jgi:exonuclease III
MKINLQHSKVATANLMQITEEESNDILCIQEPNIIQNKVVEYQINSKLIHFPRQEAE